MFDAGAGSFHAIAGVRDDHFAAAGEARDHRADGIVAAVTCAFCFGDGQLHELLSRFVRLKDHVDRLHLIGAHDVGTRCQRLDISMCGYKIRGLSLGSEARSRISPASGST